MRFIAIVLCSMLFISSRCYAEWSPSPDFSIEGSNHIETLTFVSGFSYALSFSLAYAESKHGKKMIFCVNPRNITSKILIDLANEGLSGSVSSEEFSIYIIESLAEKYPCEARE